MPWDVTLTCPEGCGYTTPRTTERLAWRGLRLHSCDRHRELAARAQRHAERMAAIDRTPRPCHHKRAAHQHGTRAAYTLDRCRCTACVPAAVDYERTRIRRTAYGTWEPFVPAAQVRAHVRQLMQQGMGLKRIMAVAGTSGGTMAKLMYGANGHLPSRQVRKATADRLLAVRPDLADGVRVPAENTWRRVHGLIALGYTRTWIARQIGQQGTGLQLRTEKVTKANADAIRTLADQYGATLGPSARSRRDAMKHGWTPDLIWQAADAEDTTQILDGSVRAETHTADSDHDRQEASA